MDQVVSQNHNGRFEARRCRGHHFALDGRVAAPGLSGGDFEGCIIPPGRNPIYFNPFVTKEESVLAIGRLWDSGKQVALLTQHTHRLPVCIVGADNPIPAPPVPIRADVRVATGQHDISVRVSTESQLRTLYSKSTIFAATSQYEPTGLASIEAAFSRCALVANDTEMYREMWGDAALYLAIRSQPVMR